MAKYMDVRFVMEDDVEYDRLMDDIGDGLEYVIGGMELKNDGFGHLLPDLSSVVVFVKNYDTSGWMTHT